MLIVITILTKIIVIMIFAIIKQLCLTLLWFGFVLIVYYWIKKESAFKIVELKSQRITHVTFIMWHLRGKQDNQGL